ncbi:MAG: linear amide C-N hydrolase [Methylococcaceae bacterium]|nr:linear amide C-N hydrolase [Methylococcaceae bacterium]
MCTRAVYIGLENTVITSRSMDWSTDLNTNLWAFPRGMNRDGAAGPRSIRWTSKYGSVVSSAFESASVDGINEMSLVVNLLYLAESEYVQPLPGDPRLPLSVAAWVQFVLDNYATVAEAVAAIRQEPFYVVPVPTPDGQPGSLHLSISDATGDSAIFEYVGGKLVIHHGRQYRVMTNSPIFEQQLALDAYWRQIGGLTMLPGTNRPADRYVRASFYINALAKTANNAEAIAGAFSVIRNASVPLRISTPEQPIIDETLWRTVFDHKNLRYYFDSARSPSIFWVDLAGIDFNLGSGVKKLTLTGGAIFNGSVAAQFQPAIPFNFIAATVN